MPAPIDLVGQRFGLLRVLERIHYPGEKQSRWFCLCDCGGVTATWTGHLQQGRTRSCGCAQHPKDAPKKRGRGRPRRNYSGEQYGHLTAIYELECNRWLCVCVCGKEVTRDMKQLRRSRNQSCGCKRKRLPDGIAARNGLYSKYRSMAKRRKLLFSLPKQHFYAVIIRPCHYCGKPPEQITQHKHSKYTYNGIDRIDNTKGYAIENCVPCCKVCNYMKRDLSYEDFIRHIYEIVSKNPPPR